MAKMKIKTLAGALTVPGPPPGSRLKYLQYSFAGMPNLYLAVFANGARVFQFKQTRLKRAYSVTIGKLGDITFDDAFQKARQCRDMVMNGIDPRQVFKVSDPVNFKDFVEQKFWPYAKEDYKSHMNVRNMLDNRILPAFGSFHLKNIDHRMIRSFQQTISEEINRRTGNKIGGATQNRTISLLSSIFKYALEHDLVDVNPCIGIRKSKESKSRERYLLRDEYVRFLQAARSLIDRPQTKAILILLALGLRPKEVFSLAWRDVHLDDNLVFLRDTKNGESRHVPLNSIAREIFFQLQNEKVAGAEWIFPSASATGHILSVQKTFRKICDKARIADFQLRDLRRSHATLLLQNGVNPFVIKEVLGHRSLKSTLVYARVPSQAMADANEIAAAKINAVING